MTNVTRIGQRLANGEIWEPRPIADLAPDEPPGAAMLIAGNRTMLTPDYGAPTLHTLLVAFAIYAQSDCSVMDERMSVIEDMIERGEYAREPGRDVVA